MSLCNKILNCLKIYFTVVCIIQYNVVLFLWQVDPIHLSLINVHLFMQLPSGNASYENIYRQVKSL